MKQSYFQFSLITGIIILCISACVPARKFEETKAKFKRCEEENAQLKSSSQELETRNNELTALKDKLLYEVNSLKRDSSTLSTSLRLITQNYDKINAQYELLFQKNKELLAGNAAETSKLAGQLQVSQDALQKKEDLLKILERDLDAKKQNLDELTRELQKRENKVKELEEILKKKDDAVNALKKKVSDALLGFENNGLTVTQKNGKVYVSLEEQLLFASGSTVVEKKGVEALKKLAKVLEQNAETSVLIEGHTDDVPMSGSGAIKDNWDLSVIRATSIVKILLANSSIDSKRLIAAGRGEFMPVDPAKTPEARKKNRRTEIILTPKLDELFQVLETN